MLDIYDEQLNKKKELYRVEEEIQLNPYIQEVSPMLISHSKKFMFFHMIKTAGKSISEPLLKYTSFDFSYFKSLSGAEQVDPEIIELIEHMDSAFSNCSHHDDLEPYQKVAWNYIYSYFTKDIDPEAYEKGTPEVHAIGTIYYLLESPALFTSVFKNYINKNYPEVYSKLHEHSSPRFWVKKLPADIFNNYFKFSIVRHPLDWLVSIYSFFTEQKDEAFHEVFQTFEDFNRFIDFFIAQAENNFEGINFYLLDFSSKSPQRDFLYDEQGNLLVDFVGKFENINEDFAKICKIIGNRDVQLPHINKSKHGHYLDYYTPETKRQIYSILKEDFKTFDYHI